MKKLTRRQIDNLLLTCNGTISDNYRQINGDTGWHQHLGSCKIGIVATAIALLYNKKAGIECPITQEALDFIVRKQNKDGGWPYISNTNYESNVESTCWALQSLYQLNTLKYNKQIDLGVNWIFTHYQVLPDKDNGWQFVDESTPRIYLTCLVLRTLNLLGKSNEEEFKSALKWLEQSQNGDGGWGEYVGNNSSLFFTSYAIITLLDSGIDKRSRIVESAILWLKNKVKDVGLEDLSFICYLEFIEKGTEANRIRIPFFHYVLPHVIMAFMVVGKCNKIVFNGLSILNSRCKSGCIEHPFLENSRIIPIWAINDTVCAFISFKEMYDNWNEISEFILLGKNIKSIGKYNPIRLISNVQIKYWKRIGFVLFVALVGFLILYSYDEIPDDWKVYLKGDNNFGKFLYSIIVSLCAGFIVQLFNKLIKKIWS